MKAAIQLSCKPGSMETNLGNIPLPADDKKRVEALHRYQILGSAPEKSFDNISNLAALFFDLPVALINFVDTESVFVKSTMDIQGATVSTPRGSSLCSLAMLSKEVTVFETLPCVDPCWLTNSIFAAELGFKFYAGAPLITHDGFSIGTICVMGYEKRTFSDKEKEMLRNMAKIVMDEIEMRLKGLYDNEQELFDHMTIRKRLEYITTVHIEMQATHLDLAHHHQSLKHNLYEVPLSKSKIDRVIIEIEEKLKKVDEVLRLVVETAKVF
jgi:hypothetical protein